MATNLIVLPTLTQWTKNHITAILQATSSTDLTSALDAFLEKDATITVNGSKISRAEFVQQLEGEKFRETGATVTFKDSVEVPADESQHFTAGSVGLFYTALIVEAIKIRGASVTSQVTVSLNVVIEQDPTIPVPPPSPIHGFFDGRRVKALNQVFLQARADLSAT